MEGVCGPELNHNEHMCRPHTAHSTCTCTAWTQLVGPAACTTMNMHVQSIPAELTHSLYAVKEPTQLPCQRNHSPNHLGRSGPYQSEPARAGACMQQKCGDLRMYHALQQRLESGDVQTKENRQNDLYWRFVQAAALVQLTTLRPREVVPARATMPLERVENRDRAMFAALCLPGVRE